MTLCCKSRVRISLPLMFLLILHWLASASPAKAQVVEAEAEGNVIRTTICEVVSNPGSFDGKIIELRADVSAGLETNVLYDKSCGSKRHLWPRIMFVESPDVSSKYRGNEYKKFWKLVQAYSESKDGRHSIVPDKYTVTATVTGRFNAASPSRAGIPSAGQLVLNFVTDVVARPFDRSILASTNAN